MDITPPPENLHLGESPARYKIPPTIYKKSIKPLIEKKRRARINASLGQLKELLLQTSQAQNPRTCRLEKADILELTVRQLERLKRADITAPGQDFMAGFSHCRRAVVTFLDSVYTLEPCVKSQILSHLDLAQSNPSPRLYKDTKQPHVDGGRPICSVLQKEVDKTQGGNFSVCEQVAPSCPSEQHPPGLARNIQHQSHSTPIWCRPSNALHQSSQYCTSPITPTAHHPPSSATGFQPACSRPVPSSGILLPVWRPW